MSTLKKARVDGKVDEFAAKRDADSSLSVGDQSVFNRALASMAGKSKAVPEASNPERDDG